MFDISAQRTPSISLGLFDKGGWVASTGGFIKLLSGLESVPFDISAANFCFPRNLNPSVRVELLLWIQACLANEQPWPQVGHHPGQCSLRNRRCTGSRVHQLGHDYRSEGGLSYAFRRRSWSGIVLVYVAETRRTQTAWKGGLPGSVRHCAQSRSWRFHKCLVNAVLYFSRREWCKKGHRLLHTKRKEDETVRNDMCLATPRDIRRSNNSRLLDRSKMKVMVSSWVTTLRNIQSLLVCRAQVGTSSWHLVVNGFLWIKGRVIVRVFLCFGQRRLKAHMWYFGGWQICYGWRIQCHNVSGVVFTTNFLFPRRASLKSRGWEKDWKDFRCRDYFQYTRLYFL